MQGFEPQLPDPESGVLPLDDIPSLTYYSTAVGGASNQAVASGAPQLFLEVPADIDDAVALRR